MLVSLALFFALLAPVVVVLLLLVAFAFALCGAAKQGDEQQAQSCEGRLHTRDGAR